MPQPKVIMDIECFPNYFLIMFMRVEDGRVLSFELTENGTLDTEKIMEVINSKEIITFNGTCYDILMLKLALKGASVERLKRASDDIIANEIKPYQFEKDNGLKYLDINYIDLIEVAPSKASLKIYGGRLHCAKMQDLPFEENKTLTPEEQSLVKTYCKNDLEVTKLLYENLIPQIELRREMSKKYKCDLRSKSDAQIAETVIKSEIQKLRGNFKEKREKIESFVYVAPDYIKFNNPRLNEALRIVTSHQFIVNSSGKIDMPEEIASLKINLGKSVYKMGMGGLHSQEKTVNYIRDDDYLVSDFDVASYYPSIILNCGLYPRQLGGEFLQVYKELVDTRLAGKKSGNKVIADSLRIVINGSFGKLGSPYSALYSPELMIQVTVTGQLALLMLIEALERKGIHVVSGNTDGIVVKCLRSKEDVLESTVSEWSDKTNFNMERTDYKAIYNRDVNNYIAIKPDGKVKTKGCFSIGGLQKNPQNEICTLAVVEFLTKGVPIEETIRNCEDVTKFLTVRTVKGGAVKDKIYLGKSLRWLYCKGIYGTINYRLNGNTVPRTFGARPLLELPEELPKDIDHNWYIKETKELLNDIGVHSTGQMSLF